MGYRKVVKLVTLISSVFVASLVFSASANAATKTWVGTGPDAKFSTAANWSDSTVPANGDDLVFKGNLSSSAQLLPEADISGLSVKSISFSGGGKCVTDMTASSTLTISNAITSDGACGSTHINGSIALGGDVVATNIYFGSRTNNSGSVNLGKNHKLSFKSAGNKLVDVGSGSVISGDGTVEFNTNSSLANLGAKNTYTGKTSLLNTGKYWLEVNYLSGFGKSSVTMGNGASVHYSLSEPVANKSVANQFTINGQKGYVSMEFACKNNCSGGKLAVPNIVLNTNVAIGARDDIVVNLAGIKSNSHCIEYWNNGGIYDGTNSKEKLTNFVNGPAACGVASSSTGGSDTTDNSAPGIPATGIAMILLKNPILILMIGLIVAAVVWAVLGHRRNLSRK